MNGFEIALLCLMGLRVVMESYLHGRPRTGVYSANAAIIRTAITMWLMYMAGLFQIFK